jgi:hypothetical protein
MLSTEIAHVLYRRNRGSFPATRTTDIPEREQPQGTKKRPYPMRQPQGSKVLPFECRPGVVEATQRFGLNTILAHVFLSLKSWAPDDCTSECISVSREFVAAAIDPHRLTALAGAVVRHAGGAPGRRHDLAALNPVCLQLTADW